MTYSAPVADMRFVLEEVAELDQLARLPGYEAASPDLVEAILDEAAKLRPGDAIDFVVTASDPEDVPLEYQLLDKAIGDSEWQATGAFSFVVKETHIGNLFIDLRIRSHRSYHAGPGFDPADSGPTFNVLLCSSTQRMEPPPLPIETTSR